MILEHRAWAALPPASSGLEEVTPKMSAHKYHFNLIMWNNCLVLDGGSGGRPKAWLRAPKNLSCSLLFSASPRPAIVAAASTSGFPAVFVRGKEAAAENCGEAQEDNVARHRVETRALCFQWWFGTPEWVGYTRLWVFVIIFCNANKGF